jgi:soluble lytic murein transglycosylase-like protein
MLSSKMFEKAVDHLTDASKSKNSEIRAEAHYSLSFIGKEYNKKKRHLDEALEATRDPELAQNVLIRRARLYKVTKGKEREFLDDLQNILDLSPGGKRSDDALYEVAAYYDYNNKLEEALGEYEKLRKFEGPNDWVNIASLRPALILYARRKPGDLEAATTLLKGLEKNPAGPYYLHALFWLGRISADQGKEHDARNYFLRIIKESPFDYHALRSRMHLNLSSGAERKILLDDKSKQDIQASYTAADDLKMEATSVYGRRLRIALETDLYKQAYKQAMDSHSRIREKSSYKRIEEMSLKDLDSNRLLAPLCLLLSLRQDALAARDKGGTAEFHLMISRAVGEKGKDYPLAISMLVNNAPPLMYEDKTALQKSKRFLRTAYPVIFKEQILKATIKTPKEKYEVPPDLLYSIARRESMFYPEALSKDGALGLCQIMPLTFTDLDEKKEWKMLKNSRCNNREEYLMNPAYNLDFAARNFNREILPRQEKFTGPGTDLILLLSIIEHNAGGAVMRDKWVKYWKDVTKKFGDVEYMIETVGYSDTKVFARNVMVDMMIVDSLGFLNNKSNK